MSQTRVRQFATSRRMPVTKRVGRVGPRRRVVVGVGVVCLLVVVVLLVVVGRFDGAWDDAMGPSVRPLGRPLVDDDERAGWWPSISRRSRSSPRPSVAVVTSPGRANRGEAEDMRGRGRYARRRLAMSTEIDEKVATRIEGAGYVRRFQRSAREEAVGGKLGFERQPRMRALKVSEKKGTRCTRRETSDRDDRGVWHGGRVCVLARFATEETLRIGTRPRMGSTPRRYAPNGKMPSRELRRLIERIPREWGFHRALRGRRQRRRRLRRGVRRESVECYAVSSQTGGPSQL